MAIHLLIELFTEGPLEMDFPLIVLLLVLAVHCQCVNIGQGRIHEQNIVTPVKNEQDKEVFPPVTIWYTRFTGWRYVPRANDMIKDIYKSTTTMTLTKCLQECYQHNQGSSTKCIAVNWCMGRSQAGQTKKCQLEADTPGFIRNLRIYLFSLYFIINRTCEWRK